MTGSVCCLWEERECKEGEREVRVFFMRGGRDIINFVLIELLISRLCFNNLIMKECVLLGGPLHEAPRHLV